MGWKSMQDAEIRYQVSEIVDNKIYLKSSGSFVIANLLVI